MDGEIPYGKLAEAVNLEEFDVRRIVRFASIHHHVFQEKRTGYVSHTAASRLLATDPQALAGLGFMFDECYQAFAHTVEALEIYKSPEPNQSVSASTFSLNEVQRILIYFYVRDGPLEIRLACLCGNITLSIPKRGNVPR